MTAQQRAELLDRYRRGPAELEAAVAGFDDAKLDASPPDGGWSPRQIVHHTADSELTSAVRLRLLLAEEGPQIRGYDQEEFARRLHYDKRPIASSLAAVRAARESCASILELLSEEDWQRSGTHSENGAYSVETWLQIYAAHCHDHADQIRRASAQ